MAILQQYLRNVYACLPTRGGLHVPGHGGLHVSGHVGLHVPGHGLGPEPAFHPAKLALRVQLERLQRPAPGWKLNCRHTDRIAVLASSRANLGDRDRDVDEADANEDIVDDADFEEDTTLAEGFERVPEKQ